MGREEVSGRCGRPNESIARRRAAAWRGANPSIRARGAPPPAPQSPWQPADDSGARGDESKHYSFASLRRGRGLEGKGHARNQAHLGLRLDTVEVVDNGDAHGYETRPIVVGQAQARCEVERIATRVGVFDAAFDLLGMPLAVEFEDEI